MPNCDLAGGSHWFINKNKLVGGRDEVFSHVELSTLHSKEMNRGARADSHTKYRKQVT